MYARIEKFLARAMRRGSLEIVDAGGKTHRYGDGTGESVRVRFTSEAAERNVANNPDMKLGEEYVDRGLVVEQGSIYDFMLLLLSNADGVLPPWPVVARAAWHYATRNFEQLNTLKRARANIHSHYDLDGRLYSLFLDEDMQYSCAYFEDGVTGLDEAQIAKKRHIAAKLDLKPGQKILDIGSGWGGLGLYLAQHFDVDVTGVTLSDEQFAVSNRRAEERGLSKRVRFLLQDYRTLQGPFDRIVSVGMFEHVGVARYPEYFDHVKRLLTADGSMLLHSIGRVGRPGYTSTWIQKYIFPGGYIPSVSEVMPAIEKSGLVTTDIEILRLHYAKTLRAWRERFLAHKDQVLTFFDERFVRLWEFYLASSEVAFRVGALDNFQIQLSKQLEALPLTRRYMVDAEDALRRKESSAADRRPVRLAGE
ncbi:MAG TPA: cyclopropane-fatty-acyl-phospholipid synthase family protein [Bauldia sp.]|nr:cyclopropane-fatty-acyl-phospholipid synthase family protein [Bauldia sp.]